MDSTSNARNKKKSLTTFFDSISLQEKINFARHLAMVVKTGLPVHHGLSIIRTQTASKTLVRVIDQLLVDVNSGRFLADSLEQYESIFGAFFINIIRVGEASGTLPQNLLYLSEELRKSKALQSKVRSAMVYPTIILVATLAVTGFLTFFIFPKLLPVLTGLNVKLPASTMVLISTVEFLRVWGVSVAVGFAALFVAAKFIFSKVNAFQYAWDRLLFYFPAVSGFVVAVNMANFTRILSLLLRSGVTITDALMITSRTFENRVYRKYVAAAADDIRKGGQLAVSLGLHKDLFPAILVGMVKVGEDTGNLEENLKHLSEFYEEEVDNKLHDVTSLLEPIMLLGMGLLVGFVAISIITPIYSMSQGVK